MAHVCMVPGCSNRSDREKNLSFHCLPLENKTLLRTWIHKIGRKNLPLNNNSRVCSAHIICSTGRYLRPKEYPTLNLFESESRLNNVSFLLILLIQAMMTWLVRW